LAAGRADADRLDADGNHASLLIPAEGRDGKVARRADEPLCAQSTRQRHQAARARRRDMAIRRDIDGATDAGPHDRRGRCPGRPAAQRQSREAVHALPAPIDNVAANGNDHALVMRNNGTGTSGW
jgi:DNA (cytosine-5)-methyltransferase 1